MEAVSGGGVLVWLVPVIVVAAIVAFVIYKNRRGIKRGVDKYSRKSDQ